MGQVSDFPYCQKERRGGGEGVVKGCRVRGCAKELILSLRGNGVVVLVDDGFLVDAPHGAVSSDVRSGIYLEAEKRAEVAGELLLAADSKGVRF